MSIHIISKLMIKFILPIVVFIAAVYGISYYGLIRVQKPKNDSFRLNIYPYYRHISNDLLNF